MKQKVARHHGGTFFNLLLQSLCCTKVPVFLKSLGYLRESSSIIQIIVFTAFLFVNYILNCCVQVTIYQRRSPLASSPQVSLLVCCWALWKKSDWWTCGNQWSKRITVILMSSSRKWFSHQLGSAGFHRSSNTLLPIWFLVSYSICQWWCIQFPRLK